MRTRIATSQFVAGLRMDGDRAVRVTGYVAGVIVFLGGLLFFPFVLFLLWMFAVGIVMLRGSGAAATG